MWGVVIFVFCFDLYLWGLFGLLVGIVLIILIFGVEMFGLIIYVLIIGLWDEKLVIVLLIVWLNVVVKEFVMDFFVKEVVKVCLLVFDRWIFGKDVFGILGIVFFMLL